MRRFAILCAFVLGCSDDGDAGENGGGSTGAATTGGPASTAPSSSGGPSSGPGTASTADPTNGTTDDPSDTDPDTGDEETSTGQVEGQWVVVAVGNWGHRGMTVDGETWTDIMNEPPKDGNDHTPDLLRGIGYGDGMFVAVGGDANGMVMTTTDGVNWDEDLFPEGDGWLGDVAFNDGIWVAVGGNGIVVRSTDGGATWAENEERLDSPGRTIIAAEGVFVASGDNGWLGTSTDGLTWDEQFDADGIGFSLAHGLDTFVGFASQWNGGGFDTACIASDDGQAWSPCPVTSASFGRPAFGENAIVVDTDEGWSVTTDGSMWTAMKGEFPAQLVHADGLWVGLSYQRRWWSNSYAGPWQSYDDPDGFRDLAAGEVFE